MNAAPLRNSKRWRSTYDRRRRSRRARAWREGLGLTRPELAALIGYSLDSVQAFEGGVNRKTGKPIDDDAWEKYKLACAFLYPTGAVDRYRELIKKAETLRANILREFDWQS